MVISILGILKSGASYLPIGYDLPFPRIKSLLEQTKALLTITTADFSNRLDYLQEENISLELLENKLFKQPTSRPEVNYNSEDLAYIIFTSGSTGQPKGAGVKHRGEVNLLQWYCKEFAFNENDRNFIISASGFDLTQKNFFAPILTGGCVVFPYSTNGDL